VNMMRRFTIPDGEIMFLRSFRSLLAGHRSAEANRAGAVAGAAVDVVVGAVAGIILVAVPVLVRRTLRSPFGTQNIPMAIVWSVLTEFTFPIRAAPADGL
jgi:hypothetical protein